MIGTSNEHNLISSQLDYPASGERIVTKRRFKIDESARLTPNKSSPGLHNTHLTQKGESSDDVGEAKHARQPPSMWVSVVSELPQVFKELES